MKTPISQDQFEVAIVGGGLAGLSLSILCARAGYKTILFEKEKYPFHKVCGEYVSLESWDFITDLGLDLSGLHLPIIKKLMVTSPGGKFLSSSLDQGGFGISRYLLDNELKKIAEAKGVTVCDGVKVEEVSLRGDLFTMQFQNANLQAKIVAGCFGKRSNLDVKWKRPFTLKKHGKLNNYLGIKYHIKADFPEDTIALHNFKDGYCGISKIENDQYCLCYLTRAQNLRDSHNQISIMEKIVLQQNPLLKKIFSESAFLFEAPVTISQISFDKKLPVENHLLMLGDAAGMIAPLCGNGMSMAMHSAKLAFQKMDMFLTNKISRQDMERGYAEVWNHHFSKRLQAGRRIQALFGNPTGTDIFISLLRYFPGLIKKFIRSTHGKAF